MNIQKAASFVATPAMNGGTTTLEATPEMDGGTTTLELRGEPNPQVAHLNAVYGGIGIAGGAIEGADTAVWTFRAPAPFIIPSVGRDLWYHPSAYDKSGPGGMVAAGDQPLTAKIVAVHNDRMVNLVIYDYNGNAHRRTSVKLLQGHDDAPENGGYAEWTPQQKVGAL